MSKVSYFQLITQKLDEIEKQSETIQEIAQRTASSIANGGVLHIFGSGHSHMIAEDIFHRAGGLACVNAMLEESLMEMNSGRATTLERLSGYGSVLLTGYDLQENETIIVISNSGINAVPIEIAMECKRRGMFVVALTNMDHSRQMDSRHSSGKKLYEVADVVLDNGGVLGDAEIELEGLNQKVGPTSTVNGIIIVQALVLNIIENLVQKGVEVPVFLSANTKDGDEFNKALEDKYKSRVRYL